jgi:hypothetical protein
LIIDNNYLPISIVSHNGELRLVVKVSGKRIMETKVDGITI